MIPFALIPLAEAIRAHNPVLPPSLESLVVASLIGAMAAGLLIAVACAAGASLGVATAAVSAGLFVFGQYPAVQFFTPAGASAMLPAVAWLWIGASLAVAAVVMVRRPQPGSALQQTINIGALVLTLLLGFHAIRGWSLAAPRPASGENALAIAETTATPPDIYHIIVDGLGHPDVLRSMYDLDLAGPLEALTRAGFTMGPRTFANYAQTDLSLASILNAEYVQSLVPLAEGDRSRVVLRDLIQDARVIRALKDHGYRFELLSGPYSATESHRLADACECSRAVVGHFESTLIRLTPLGDTGLGGLDFAPHRRKVRRTLDALAQLGPSDSPRLVLAHIMSPHPPFVFDARGEGVDPPRAFSINDGSYFGGPDDEYRSGYRAQAAFIVSRLPEIAVHLETLSRSQGRDAVIVIHGDHGPRRLFDAHDASRSAGAESLPVFLAIRWPAPVRGTTVASPVNIYRAIFQRYFIPGLEQLPDRSYMSSFDRPYAFLEVDPATLPPR